MLAVSPAAMAAGVEVTLQPDLPSQPTGLQFNKGAFYGGAVVGVSSYGAVYQLVPPSKTNPNWSVKLLHVFNYEADGAIPHAAVIADKAGNLYGSTFASHVGNAVGYGTLFKLVPSSGSQTNWSLQTIYAFQTPGQPQVKLAIDPAGILYLAAGDSVLQFTPPATGSGAYTMAAIPIPSGCQADSSGVVIDRFGNLYGVGKTIATSPPAYDIIYQLTPPAAAGAQWTGQALQSFPSDAHVGQLRLSPKGQLFSTTSPVGAGCDAGNCAVFELVQSGKKTWTEQIVHSFAGDPLGSPASNVGPAYAGNDYQLSFAAGDVIYGAIIPSQSQIANSTIYRLTPPASGQTAWTETVLYTFQGTPNGFSAGTPLYIPGNGSVYGTAYGGARINGSVYQQSLAFKITPP